MSKTNNENIEAGSKVKPRSNLLRNQEKHF